MTTVHNLIILIIVISVMSCTSIAVVAIIISTAFINSSEVVGI